MKITCHSSLSYHISIGDNIWLIYCTFFIYLFIYSDSSLKERKKENETVCVWSKEKERKNEGKKGWKKEKKLFISLFLAYLVMVCGICFCVRRIKIYSNFSFLLLQLSLPGQLQRCLPVTFTVFFFIKLTLQDLMPAFTSFLSLPFSFFSVMCSLRSGSNKFKFPFCRFRKLFSRCLVHDSSPFFSLSYSVRSLMWLPSTFHDLGPFSSLLFG